MSGLDVMTEADVRLAARLLKWASEKMADASCNDFDFREWGIASRDEWHRLRQEAEEANGSGEDVGPMGNPYTSDFMMADLMEEKLRRLADRMRGPL